MRIYRFLTNKKFQIDDALWRCHINLVFDILMERGIISKDKPVLIKVDFTSNEDNFLILSASVDLNECGFE